MQPLDERVRRRLLTVSAMVCAIPSFLAPLAGRTSFELASERAAFNARFSSPHIMSPWSDSPLLIARDPFVADAVEKQPAASVTGMHVVQGQPTGFVVPASQGAPGIAVQDATLEIPLLRAVATGKSSRAIVEEHGRARVVGLGDLIAGSPIVAIEPNGLRLKDGTTLTMTAEHQ